MRMEEDKGTNGAKNFLFRNQRLLASAVKRIDPLFLPFCLDDDDDDLIKTLLALLRRKFFFSLRT